MVKIIYLLLASTILGVSNGDLSYCESMSTKLKDKIVKRSWELKLHSNTSFRYTIIENSKYLKEQSLESDTMVYDGVWRFADDTLYLYSDICKDTNTSVVKYQKKGKKLYSLGYCIDNWNGKVLKSLKGN